MCSYYDSRFSVLSIVERAHVPAFFLVFSFLFGIKMKTLRLRKLIICKRVVLRKQQNVDDDEIDDNAVRAVS